MLKCKKLAYATAGKTVSASTSVICTVLVLDVFGWTTFAAMERSQTLDLVNIEDGEVILAATMMTSRYHVFRMRLYHVCFFLLFTALHAMQMRFSYENSVCPSVRPSVKRVHCDKTEERSVLIFIP